MGTASNAQDDHPRRRCGLGQRLRPDGGLRPHRHQGSHRRCELAQDAGRLLGRRSLPQAPDQPRRRVRWRRWLRPPRLLRCVRPSRLREAELKHGRFAMLAVLGFLVQEKYTLPFFPKMAPVDAHDYFVQQGGGSQIIFWISFVEIFGVVALFETLQGKREPGDFAFDPLGLAKDEATLERYRVAEIKHSRLAMIAIGGFIHQYWVTKQTVFEQLGNFKSLS